MTIKNMADALNKLSDRACAAVNQAEFWLSENGIGPLPYVKGKWRLSYERVSGKMRIAVSSETSPLFPFAECSRECKLEAIELLPKLLETIEVRQVELVARAGSAVDEAEKCIRRICS